MVDHVSRAKSELKKYASKKKAEILQGFFKTGPGQYGEGDIFLGVTVPDARKTAKMFPYLDLPELKVLLGSNIHEHRLLALLILVSRFEAGDLKSRKKIFDFYVNNTASVNSWDLVDLTAPKIAGAYMFDKEKTLLYKWAGSDHLWERRIAIVATYYFIKRKSLADTFQIAGLLIVDKHDLIHKAVGWMLREAGKIDLRAEEEFLKKYYKKMPRTMLRYAIERFPKSKRYKYLKSLV